jgi:hypothetical protein
VASHPELARCVKHCVHCGIRFLIHPRSAHRRNVRCPFGCREHHRRQRACQRSTAYYQTAHGQRKKKGHNLRRAGRGGSTAACPRQKDTPPAQDPVANSDATSAPTRPGPETVSELSAAAEAWSTCPPSPPVESRNHVESACQAPPRASAKSHASSATLPVVPPPWPLPLAGVVLDEASVTTSRLLPYVTLVVNLIEGTSYRCPEVADLLRRTMRQHRFAKRSRRDYVLWVLHHHPPWEDPHGRNGGTADPGPAL